MNSEFDLIRRYFSRPMPAGILGPGDDCALLSPAPGTQLAISTDMLVEGRHFFSDVDPASLGHKALAVNLSDLAAMGARPLGCLLSLALPRVNPAWLEKFSQSLHGLAAQTACPLMGGDLVRSEHGISMNMTVMGEIPAHAALRRDAARIGDDIWVSGTLGEADIALRLLQGRLPADAQLLAQTRQALEWPQAQLALGQALRGVAHAAIDLSDGLLQDLRHILHASGCGAQLDYDALPIAASLRHLPETIVRQAVLTGGEQYQLCFTAACTDHATVLARAAAVAVPVTKIGQITAQDLNVVTRQGDDMSLPQEGFDHFAPSP